MKNRLRYEHIVFRLRTTYLVAFGLLLVLFGTSLFVEQQLTDRAANVVAEFSACVRDAAQCEHVTLRAEQYELAQDHNDAETEHRTFRQLKAAAETLETALRRYSAEDPLVPQASTELEGIAVDLRVSIQQLEHANHSRRDLPSDATTEKASSHTTDEIVGLAKAGSFHLDQYARTLERERQALEVRRVLATRLLFAAFLMASVGLGVVFVESAIRDVKSALSQVEDSNRMKSEFLANMSHEIRTPMTAILGYADYLLDEGDRERAPKHRIEAIQTIRRNGKFLLEIINDVLDLSKIESQKLKLEKRNCSPEEIARDVHRLMSHKASEKGLDLTLDFVTEIPRQIPTDPIRLRQVLVNLLGNAIKFTEHGFVTLVVRYIMSDQGRIEFEVADSGIGMTREQCERVFDAFSQADTTTTREYGGTGLGLTISRRLAKLLGGDLQIVESAPGHGSRFLAFVPAGPQASDGFHRPRYQVTSDSNSSAAGQESMNSNASLADLRILLAEDGEDNQKLISYMLKKAGAQVIVVENGQLAVEAALLAEDTDRSYDVILMDMQMPVLDGYEATAKLRSSHYRGMIIALTAHAKSGDRERCLEAGCDEFVTKPIDRQRLVEACKKADLQGKATWVHQTCVSGNSQT